MIEGYIITIGASAGGIQAISTLVSKLPAEFPAAILVVIHTATNSKNYLADILARASKLPVITPKDGEKLQLKKIYVAPPDKHMIVEDGILCLQHGPKINHSRPAIDPLFCSAAIAYNTKVIGVILSGLLDDGAAGLLAIKRRGGTTIVQDPKDAQFPDMPRHALSYSLEEVDYCMPVADIAGLLAQLIHQAPKNESPNTMLNELETEVQMCITVNGISEEEMNKLGSTSAFSCPECHGVLWEIEEGSALRFRCRLGHAFGLESLLATLSENVENALWTTLRAMEEKANLAVRIANRPDHKKQKNAVYFTQKAEHAKQHTETIRKLLLNNAKEAE